VTDAGPTPDYQWQVDGTDVATGPVFTSTTLREGQIVTLRLRTTDVCGQPATAVSNGVAVQIQPLVTPTVSLVTPPEQCPGTPLTFEAAPTNAGAAPTFQWFVNNVAVATGPTFTNSTLVTGDQVRVEVTPTAGLCTTGSATATVTVRRTVPTPPPTLTIAVQPGGPVCPGEPLTFNIASVTDAGPTPEYQWQVDGTDVAGATGTVFTSTTLREGQIVTLRLRTTNNCGQPATAVSNPVAAQVQPVVTPTVTLTAPPEQCPGTPLTFTAVPTNAGTAPTFNWFVNNVAVTSGPTFTNSTLVSGDQVRVEVTPTAGLCSTGPATATVTVTRTAAPQPTLAIAAQPGGPVCLGAPLTFSIASVTEAGPAPEYQWQVDGTDVAGATGPTFTSTTLREGQTVTLRLRTTNVCGQSATAVSNGVAVRIQPPVDVDAGPDKEILAGTSVILEGRADGTYPVTWTPTTGLTFPTSDQLQPRVSPTVTTTYTLSAGEGGCADSDQVTVTVRPPIRIPNAFTPNGDGRDDTWQIEFIEQFPDNTVTVFNRWGNKIFSANNYSRANEWRGDINGQPAPVGTYYYVVVTKGPLGRSYSGSITILY
jgi:gliding motility-associated-like protein